MRLILFSFAFFILIGFSATSVVGLSSCQGCPLTFYLDPVNGNDTFNGLSSSTAWKTLNKSIDALTTYPDNPILFKLAPGEYGAFSALISSDRSGWATYTSSDTELPQIDWVQFETGMQNVNVRIVFDSINFTSMVETSSTDNWATIDLGTVPVNYVSVSNSYIEPVSEEANNTLLVPIGVNIRDSANISLFTNTIIGARYGVILRGNDLYFEGNEVYNQWGDGIRVISADGVVINDNYIHDVYDYYNTSEHIDGIQLFPASPNCTYINPRNIEITNNEFYQLPGQMLFISGGHLYCLDPIEHVLIENNTFGQKKLENADLSVQIDEVVNFSFVKNTVYDSLLVRGSSEGLIEDNIIGFLSYLENGTATEDYNLIGAYDNSSQRSNALGEHSVLGSALFVDHTLDNYEVLPGTQACSMSSIGEEVGSIGCVACTPSDNLISLFHPSEIFGYSGNEIEFNASYSLQCGNESMGSLNYSWNFDDGTEISGMSYEVIDHTFLTGGMFEVELLLTDMLSHESTFNRTITIVETIEPNLVVFYEFENNSLDSSGREFHGTWNGTENYTAGINGSAMTVVDASSYVQVPDDSSFEGLEETTISIWAKRNAGSSSGTLLNKHVHYLIDLDGDSATFTVWDDEGNSASVSTTVLEDNAWHHYALTYDGDVLTAYVDGVANGTDSALDGPLRSTTFTGWELKLGHSAVGNDSFDGALDEFKMYDRALNATEIQELYSEA